MLAQLPQQPVLQAGGGPGWVGYWGEGLVGGDEQVFAEGQAQHIQVLSAIAEGAGEGHKHWRGRARWGSQEPPFPSPPSPQQQLLLLGSLNQPESLALHLSGVPLNASQFHFSTSLPPLGPLDSGPVPLRSFK